MIRALYICGFYLTILVCVASSHNLEYSDLEDIGGSCPPFDSCAGSRRRSFLTSSCRCDSECGSYDDCCINAPESSGNRLSNIECMPTAMEGMGVYVINKCPESWDNQYIKEKCEGEDDSSDPILAAPAVDTENGKAYRNRYCAECHDADQELLKSWEIKLDCSSLSDANKTYANITNDYIFNHIRYDDDLSRWGLFYWNDTLMEEMFYTCTVFFDLPRYLKDDIRYCRTSVISKCAAGWSGRQTKKNCRDYMAVVQHEGKFYRNPHCMQCNNKALNDEICGGAFLATRGKSGLSFTLLLDINLSDGSRVGEIVDNRCDNGEKWDPFFDKCRQVVCGFPGFSFVNGKCVQD